MTIHRQINGFDVYIVADAQEGGQKAFQFVQASYHQGATVFGLATGSTPETLYDCIRRSELTFTSCVSVNLDEYVGLSPDHPQSYRSFMQQVLFNDKPFKTHYIPNGLADKETELQRYNHVLDDNPIDLQILGIGTNAHIAFNEPGTSFDTKTHCVKLTDATIKANQRFFEHESDVPRYAYSMGIASIMKAKKIILMAYGSQKSNAVYQMLYAKKTQQIPATALQDHPNVTVIVDQQAAKNILRDDIPIASSIDSK